MNLKETYFGNVRNVKKMDPGAVIIDVTRRAGSVLSPSWDMLNEYKLGKMAWDGYISRFLQEMDNPECKAEMLRIGELAMIIEACRRMNQLVTERPDIVEASYDTIAKELRVEA
jgi:hypothetical protein